MSTLAAIAPWLPMVNASLNSLAALLLVVGLRQVRAGDVEAHRRTMTAAFGVSVVFLASYLVYHSQVGSVRYLKQDWTRPIYLFVLATHVVLAALVPVLAIRTLWLGYQDRPEQHRRWARWTWPIWMYVSVTGVIVYLMLYPMGGSIAG